MFVRNADGIARLLKGAEMRRAIQAVAGKVASNAAGSTDMPIATQDFTTDRAGVTVAIAHPGGAAEQAKNGTLTKAAMAAGLEVRSG